MSNTKQTLAKYFATESFARQYGVNFFHDGRVIGYQILVEEGYVRPYQWLRKPSLGVSSVSVPVLICRLGRGH